MEETPNYHIIIPANVRYDESLSPSAKLLYGEIIGTCDAEEGYPRASNRYFADLYNVSCITVSRWVRELRDGGYIKAEIIYKDGTKEIIGRKIYLTRKALS